METDCYVGHQLTTPEAAVTPVCYVDNDWMMMMMMMMLNWTGQLSLWSNMLADAEVCDRQDIEQVRWNGQVELLRRQVVVTVAVLSLPSADEEWRHSSQHGNYHYQ